MTLFIFIAFFSGMLLSLQQAMGGALGLKVGSMASSVVNHLGGAVLGAALLGLGVATGHLHMAGVPLLYFFGGCFGVLMVALINVAIPTIGVAGASLLLLSGQLITSLLMDQLGWLGGDIHLLNLQKIAGIILLLTGAALVFVKKEF
ncbi:MAG: DMT family transporter [Deltaproteobacteria bacterium]|nr:DMT family transporter [Deltaproteobacteria bacterium]